MNEIKFEQMPVSETWGSTNLIAWIVIGDDAPVLMRAWQRRETGEIDWRPLETVYLPKPNPNQIPNINERGRE